MTETQANAAYECWDLIKEIFPDDVKSGKVISVSESALLDWITSDGELNA